jgi:predicted RNase H-like HicB family nuclease
MQETGFSTTVAGTQYSGSVEEFDGEYVASVSSLSGATASGSSLIEAENNLTVRIDELVLKIFRLQGKDRLKISINRKVRQCASACPHRSHR